MLANLNLVISVIVGFEFSFFSPMFLDLILSHFLNNKLFLIRDFFLF